ncbi:MAG: phosphatase PAP2 family protein [Tissierellia bacterium]|nr:phosphatase PAP2 family protein [Tissierellia bacterium]
MRNKDVIESFNHAVSGIISALKTEGHMKIHYFAAIAVILLSLFLDLSRMEFTALILTVALVIITEMLNTAIEHVVDMVSPEYHPKARLAKDVAAGAVLVSAIASVFIGYLIFYDRFSNYSISIIDKVRKNPVHLTFLAMSLVIFAVIGLKTKYSKGHGTFFKGGKVSGHSAIAFAIATIVSFIAHNFLIIILTMFLAAMVAESRIEGEIHSLDEVVLGGILGVAIALFVFAFFLGR